MGIRNVDILAQVGQRLLKLRKHFNYTPLEMAVKLRLHRSGYYKNEKGETFPGFSTLKALQADLHVSLDWLVFGKGPMFYEEKELPEVMEKEPAAGEREKIAGLLKAIPDVKDLLEHMLRDPVLRHEVLLNFYKYKEQKKNTQSTEEKTGTENGA